MDPKAIVVCTNLKHWKMDMKKSCGKCVGFTNHGGLEWMHLLALLMG